MKYFHIKASQKIFLLQGKAYLSNFNCLTLKQLPLIFSQCMHNRAAGEANAKEEQLLPDGRVNVFNARQRAALPRDFPSQTPPASRNRVINKGGGWGNVGWQESRRRRDTKVGQTLTETHTCSSSSCCSSLCLPFGGLLPVVVCALSAASTSLFNFSCGSGQGFDLWLCRRLPKSLSTVASSWVLGEKERNKPEDLLRWGVWGSSSKGRFALKFKAGKQWRNIS